MSRIGRDLEGMRFGKLIAVEPIGSAPSCGNVIWRCICDCGKETTVTTGNLGKHTKSCGCLRAAHRKPLSHHVRKRREDRLQKKFGISTEQYWAMRKSQQELCFICMEPLIDENGKLCPVDHCHKTGRVRSIVYDRCNKALGLFNENPNILRNAATYLETYA